MRVSSNSIMTSAQSKIFGAEMKRRRGEVGMSTKEFARYVGISQAYVCNLESANRKPSPQLAEKIAEAFSTTVNEMLVPADDRVKEFREKYGATLRKHRMEKGLPCAVIAGALGIPVAVYKEYEQGLCSITDGNMWTLDTLLGIGEKPKAVENEVVVEVPAEIPAEICNIILEHVRDLQVSEDEQRAVWRYFTGLKLDAEERRLFG